MECLRCREVLGSDHCRDFGRLLEILRRKSSQSEVLVKSSLTWAKNALKTWRNVCRFPGKVGARHFTKNPRQISFFHRETLGAGGPKISEEFLRVFEIINAVRDVESPSRS